MSGQQHGRRLDPAPPKGWFIVQGAARLVEAAWQRQADPRWLERSREGEPARRCARARFRTPASRGDRLRADPSVADDRLLRSAGGVRYAAAPDRLADTAVPLRPARVRSPPPRCGRAAMAEQHA